MNNYKTSDLQLASTLYALGYQLLSLDRSNPRRITFVFESSESLDRNISEFYADSLLINPRRLFSASRLVKERLYGEA